ncbi:MAG TPA: Zn-ribbon domain-containing OB-fold protein [Bdellovibrionota bacterium]|nr:Zn-ribbon domain-containing OB-fold protein [Bdellovibrionota bacterium]
MKKTHLNFAGTPLSNEVFVNNKVSITESNPNAQYEYDTGLGIGKFLQGLKEGKILGTHCEKCNRTVVPPRIFCELCFGTQISWKELKTTGRVNTFSLCYVNWDATIIKEPHIPAVIEIDGATPPCGIMHLIDEVRPEDVKIGMKVQAVFKDERERQGSITDIKYWVPIK